MVCIHKSNHIARNLGFLIYSSVPVSILVSFLGEHHIFLKDIVSLMIFPYNLGPKKTFKIHGLYIHCKYLQPNYSLITAKGLYLRLNYSHWQCTVIGCNSIQPNYSSDTVFDCNYEFSHIYGKFSYFWLQFGCTKQVLVWYAAFNWYRFLRLERFCD